MTPNQPDTWHGYETEPTTYECSCSGSQHEHYHSCRPHNTVKRRLTPAALKQWKADMAAKKAAG